MPRGRPRIHPVKVSNTPKVRRKGRFETPKPTAEDLMTYKLYLLGTGPKDPNRPRQVRAKDIKEAISYAVDVFGKERLIEVHDYADNLIWGRNTGINKEYFVR